MYYVYDTKRENAISICKQDTGPDKWTVEHVPGHKIVSSGRTLNEAKKEAEKYLNGKIVTNTIARD